LLALADRSIDVQIRLAARSARVASLQGLTAFQQTSLGGRVVICWVGCL
jgi:hypothetical protein